MRTCLLLWVTPTQFALHPHLHLGQTFRGWGPRRGRLAAVRGGLLWVSGAWFLAATHLGTSLPSPREVRDVAFQFAKQWVQVQCVYFTRFAPSLSQSRGNSKDTAKVSPSRAGAGLGPGQWPVAGPGSWVPSLSQAKSNILFIQHLFIH